MSTLITTVTPMTTGLDEVTGSGEEWSVVFAGTWRECDRVTLVLNDGVNTYTLGAGDTTGIDPTFLYTFNDKLYALSGSAFYFSAIGDPAVFNDPSANGNGYFDVPNYFSAPEDLVAMAHYQGNLAFLSRTTTHIWNINANPTEMSQRQLLENLGTFAPQSVQALGDLDVIFLYDSGVRSLRVRDSSNNAQVVDVGSPIDSLIIEKLLSATQAEREAACSCIDPVANRYWLFLKDTIYVLSYFPQNKVVAWSAYLPTDETGATFVPEKMMAYNGQVHIRATDGNFYLYGGDDNNTYDGTIAIVEIPWLDDNKPTEIKQFSSVDASISGTWSLAMSSDLLNGTLTNVGPVQSTTFNNRRLGYNGRGTHFKLRATTNGNTAAKLSSLVVHYEGDDNR